MQTKHILLMSFCVLLAGCCTWLEPMNEFCLKGSGQFYEMVDGEKVPFRHKVKYRVNYQMEYPDINVFVYNGVNSCYGYQIFYSDEEGHFSFKLDHVSSKKVTIKSSYVLHDSLEYKTKDTFELKNLITVYGMEIVFRDKPVYRNPDQAKYPSSCFVYKDLSKKFKIKNADDVKYSYSDTRNPAEPVFNLSQFAGDTTTIYALNVGVDTFYVEYMTQAESPQPKRAPIVVEVKEWKK